jgi:hypothetical protein
VLLGHIYDQISVHFKAGVSSFLTVEKRVLYMFQIKVLCHIRDFQILSFKK